jgi:uncharacterized protein with HEPN domain
MRDLLIHHYDNVNLHSLWLTVAQDIAALIASPEPLAARDGDDA